MALVTFVDDNPPYLNAQNLNNNFNELQNGVTQATQTTQAGYITISQGTSAKTITNASYGAIDSNSTITLNVKKGNTIVCVLTVGGISNSNTGYSVYFDVQMDGTTRSSSGAITTSKSDWGNNWSTDASVKIAGTYVFIFKNVSTGNHTFTPVWSSGNASTTATIAQFAICKLIAFETL